MKQWKKEICDTQPEEVQLIAPELLMQRRNIKVVEHESTDNMEAYTDYECESREISVSEYEMIKSVEQINTDKAIEDYTLQLMEEGVL